MKTQMVNGVECAQASEALGEANKIRILAFEVGRSRSECSLCPNDAGSETNTARCTCEGGPYVELKYVPILQMRGVPFK